MDQPPSAATAEQAEKRSVALWSIVASLGLTIAKLLAGLATGSLGLLSEAAHSLLDFGATAITYWAIRVSERPADSRHHYGHAKVESVAALIETGLLFITAIGVAIEALRRLSGHESAVGVTWWAIAIIVGSIVIDFYRARSLQDVAKRTHSAALEADALHFSSDMVSSIAVLAGLLLVALGYPWADALAALLVSVFIVLAGWRLGGRTIDTLMDAAPEGIIERIEAAGEATQGVLRLERVRARPSGAALFVDAQIVVPRTLPFDRASAIKDALAARLRRDMPEADISLSLLPVELTDETAFDKVMLVASRQGVAVHHVTIQHITDRKNGTDKMSVSLDLEVDGAMPLGGAHAVATRLEDAIEKELGDGVEVESHIEPMLMTAVEGTDIAEPERARMAALLTELARTDGRLKNVHDVRARRTPLGLLVTIHCQAGPGTSVQAVHDAVHDLELAFQARLPEVKRLIGHAEPG
jgi:cation diffusion facilitator family transporter